jgi:hypothetical protein
MPNPPKSEYVVNSGWIVDAWNGFWGLDAFHQLEFLITIIGFAVTAFSAIAALIVARNIKNKILLVDSISDIAKVQALIEEIRRHLRMAAWVVLPERYTELRHLLVSVKNEGEHFSTDQQTILTKVIVGIQRQEEIINKNGVNGLARDQAIEADKLLRDHADKMNGLNIQTRKKAN